MMVREAIDRYKAAATIIAIFVAVGAAAYLVHGMTAKAPTIQNLMFFSSDDGRTVFADNANHIPPFEHNGQPAYRVYMYSSDGGATKFPGYLERFTPDAKAKLEASIRDLLSGASRTPAAINPHEIEVKKPGAGNPWVSRADPAAAKITAMTGPNGPQELVMP